MSDTLLLVLAFAAGGVLGTAFFGGLWWTVRAGVSSVHPARWFLLSLLVRMAVALVGFYLVSSGHWQRLLACLVGFLVARFVVMRLTLTADVHATPAPAAQHAP